MKSKKILSALIAGAMSLSMVNGAFAVTEGTGNFVKFDGSFDKNASGWARIYRGETGWSKDYDHTGNGGGSLKFSAKTYTLGYSDEDCGITKDITAAGLKKGKTYKVTAWIYGERVKPATTGISGTPNHEAAVYFDFSTNVNNTSFPDNVLGNITSLTSLVQGEWTKVESYFVAQGEKHTLKIYCPYYYDDKKYPDDYDIFYVDDVTFEEQTNADILHYTPNYDEVKGKQYLVNTRSYNRLNPDNEIKSGAKYIDLTETQRHIKLGETAELNASILTAVKGQKASTIAREKVDNQYVTVETEKDFLTYKDGVFTPVNAGSTVAKITYDDGTFKDTRNLLVTVYADGAEMCDSETMDTWQYPTITDPIDKYNNIYVGTAVNYAGEGAISAKTPVAANKQTVISYRSYFSGLATNDKGMGEVKIFAGKNNSWTVGGNVVPLYIRGTNFTEERPGILTGWNNIDYVFEPVAENTSDVSIYFNGNFVGKASNVTMAEDSTFSCTVDGGVLIDDFKVVTVDLEPKVSQVNLPGEGETLSTLDDFDVIFASPMEVADGGIKLIDSDNNEAAVRLFASDDKKTYTIRPDGGLKPNTDYKLVFVPENISLATNSAIKLSASTPEYTFKTDNTIVSDITGNGYTLLNAQHDMIGNGIYKLGSTAQLIEETKELKASYVSQTENFPTPFTFSAEKNFVNDTQKGDRYIVEFDAKVDMKEVTATTKCNEWFTVTAVDKDGNSSIISRPGTDPWSDNVFTLRFSDRDHSGDKSLQALLYDTTQGHDKVQLFGEYMHFKFVFEFGQDNEMGKIKQTFYLTDTTGKEYVYGPVYSCGSGSGDLGVNFDPVAVNSVYWNSRQKADRDLSIKNVSIYSLKKSEEEENAVDLKDFIVLDENSNAVSSVTAGKKYSVSCKAANNAYDGDSITVIAGIFNADNKLVAVKSAATAAPKGTEDTINIENLDLSNASEDTYTLKVFCWNSLDAAVPLTDFYSPLAQ